MMMPTPIHHQSTAYPNFMPGLASPLLMQAATGGQDQAAAGGPPAAMAFTYVPIPVYNLGGMQMTGEFSNNIPNVFFYLQCCGSGSGSISQRYGSGSGFGSGSFYHQAKIVTKTLIPTALRLHTKMSWIRKTVYLASFLMNSR
jgi:hypothetical protein